MQILCHYSQIEHLMQKKTTNYYLNINIILNYTCQLRVLIRLKIYLLEKLLVQKHEQILNKNNNDYLLNS